MSVAITASYAAFLAIIFLGLSLATIRFRRKFRVPLADGGHGELARLIRAHGNFAEYVPFTLLLMLTGEIGRSPALLLHGMGALLTLGRIFHIFSIVYAERVKKVYTWRTVGMSLTFTALILGAVNCAVLAF